MLPWKDSQVCGCSGHLAWNDKGVRLPVDQNWLLIFPPVLQATAENGSLPNLHGDLIWSCGAPHGFRWGWSLESAVSRWLCSLNTFHPHHISCQTLPLKA